MKRFRVGRRFARVQTFNLVRRDDDGQLLFRLLLRRVGDVEGFVRYDRLPVPLSLHQTNRAPRLRPAALLRRIA